MCVALRGVWLHTSDIQHSILKKKKKESPVGIIKTKNVWMLKLINLICDEEKKIYFYFIYTSRHIHIKYYSLLL